jgi:hypothetical protein
MASWWSKCDDLEEATEVRKVNSVRSVELITLLNILVTFAHIIQIAACKEYTNARPLVLWWENMSADVRCLRLCRTADDWQLSRCECENRSVDGDEDGCLSDVEDFIGRTVTKRLI